MLADPPAPPSPFLNIPGLADALPVARGQVALYGVTYSYERSLDGAVYRLVHGKTVLRADRGADGTYRLRYVEGPRPASSVGFQTLEVLDGRLVLQRRRAA